MTLTRLQKIVLGGAGLTAIGIGGAILFVPGAFYAGYGIELGRDASLLSELRAFAAGLSGLGALMLAGVLRGAIAQISLTAALVVYLGFPVGRILGLVLDGMPSGAILGALGFELVVAGVLIAAFVPRQKQAHPVGAIG